MCMLYVCIIYMMFITLNSLSRLNSKQDSPLAPHRRPGKLPPPHHPPGNCRCICSPGQLALGPLVKGLASCPPHNPPGNCRCLLIPPFPPKVSLLVPLVGPGPEGLLPPFPPTARRTLVFVGVKMRWNEYITGMPLYI